MIPARETDVCIFGRRLLRHLFLHVRMSIERFSKGGNRHFSHEWPFTASRLARQFFLTQCHYHLLQSSLLVDLLQLLFVFTKAEFLRGHLLLFHTSTHFIRVGHFIGFGRNLLETILNLRKCFRYFIRIVRSIMLIIMLWLHSKFIVWFYLWINLFIAFLIFIFENIYFFHDSFSHFQGCNVALFLQIGRC